MFKKIFKNKKIFFFFKLLNNLKKKIFLTLGPIGNYSFLSILKNINKNIKLSNIINIKLLNLNLKKIIPYENNNGGIVKDCLNLLFYKKCFINSIIILNIKHNFYIYKKKKIFFLHNQSFKQINKTINIFLKKIKIKFTNSNSNINYGYNICNILTKKIFPINIKKIKLKNNLINKTKFILNVKNNNKKKFLSFFFLKKIFFEKFFLIYKKKNIYYSEIFLSSFKNFLFDMKKIKKKTKILIVGYYNII